MDTKEVIDLVDLPTDEILRSAEWRREKAAEYPEDAERNLFTARELEALAKEVGKLHGTPLHKRYHVAFEKHLSRLTEIEQEMIRSIGFYLSYSGEEFIEDIIKDVSKYDDDDDVE